MCYKPCLLYGNLVYSTLVAASFKRCAEEVVHNGNGFFVTDESAGHYQYVGVVVLAGETGYFGMPAEGGTDALVLVQRHADTFTATADGDAGVACAFFNGKGKRVGVVGIVAASFAVGSEIFIGDAFFLKISLYKLLKFISGMIACQTDCLDFHTLYDYDNIAFTCSYTFWAV